MARSQTTHHTVERETGRASLNPEKELMLSVIQEAKDNLTNKKRNIREDAHAWFMEGKSNWYFSFYSICEELDIDYKTMRRKIFTKLGIIGPV